MKFDQDILFDFLPEEDKKSFMVWDNVFLSRTSSHIVATYRAPFEERLNIPFEEYQMKLKQKEREEKLNKIL
jgi:hypothetical protein